MTGRRLATGAALIAVGFAAGWLVFDMPIRDGGLSTTDIESRLLERERSAGRDADDAACEPRQATSTQFLCTVIYGLGAGTASGVVVFLATTKDDGSRIVFARRT